MSQAGSLVSHPFASNVIFFQNRQQYQTLGCFCLEVTCYEEMSGLDRIENLFPKSLLVVVVRGSPLPWTLTLASTNFTWSFPLPFSFSFSSPHFCPLPMVWELCSKYGFVSWTASLSHWHGIPLVNRLDLTPYGSWGVDCFLSPLISRSPWPIMKIFLLLLGT